MADQNRAGLPESDRCEAVTPEAWQLEEDQLVKEIPGVTKKLSTTSRSSYEKELDGTIAVIRPFLALFGVLFCGGLSAFFLFVPPLLIATALVATTFLLLTGFVLMYSFGFQAELQPAPPSDDSSRTD